MNVRGSHGLKAIETSYHGCLFRSRLEARWAVFLDSIKVKWEYEKEGYDLDGTWYLPDFWIPLEYGPPGEGWGSWIEIKPTPLDAEQIKLLGDLARITGHRTYAVCGQPWPDEHQVSVFYHHHHGEPRSIPFLSAGRLTEEDEHQHPAMQAYYREIGYWPPPKFRDIRVVSGEMDAHFVDGYSFSTGDVSLMDAFHAARSARFEHGESPRIPR